MSASFVGGGGRRSRAALAGVCLVVAGIVGVAVAAGSSPGPATYESQAVLLFDQPGAIAASGDEGVILKMIRLRVKYADLVATDPIIERTAEGLGVPADQVRGRARAVVPNGSLLLRIVGSGPTPEAARRFAAATAESLQDHIDDEQRRIVEEQRIVAELVGEPRPGVDVGGGARRPWLLGALGFGLALAMAAVVVQVTGRWSRP